MIRMKVIPSVFLKNMMTMKPRNITNDFQYFENDLPHPETFESDLLQWLVSLLF